MRKALAAAANPPKKITTDKYSAYPVAMREVFPKGMTHIQSRGAKHFVNNNMSERMQGIYRAREKTLRGNGQHRKRATIIGRLHSHV